MSCQNREKEHEKSCIYTCFFMLYPYTCIRVYTCKSLQMHQRSGSATRFVQIHASCTQGNTLSAPNRCCLTFIPQATYGKASYHAHHGVSTKFQYFFHDFSMTEALKSRTVYMLCGMKETCTEAASSSWGPQYWKMWETPTFDQIT